LIIAVNAPQQLDHQQNRAGGSVALLNVIREHWGNSLAWLNSSGLEFESGGIQSWWKSIRPIFQLQAIY
jgi:hypothetical protein